MTEDTTTEDNLIAALNELTLPDVPEVEYRVYYDKETRECTYTTTETMEWPDDFPYVLVTREQYDAIEFAPKYYVTTDERIERIALDFGDNKKLTLTDTSKTQTIKDDNIFVADESFDGEKDNWTIKTNKI